MMTKPVEAPAHLARRPYSLAVSFTELSALERILNAWRLSASVDDVSDRNATDDLAKRLTSMRAIAGLMEES